MTPIAPRPHTIRAEAGTAAADIVDRLRMNEDDKSKRRMQSDCAEAADTITALRSRVAELEQDAARYRWLRDSPVEAVKMGGDLYRKADTIYLKHLHLQDLDAAIDWHFKD